VTIAAAASARPSASVAQEADSPATSITTEYLGSQAAPVAHHDAVKMAIPRTPAVCA
jgi:hypothetical protein